MKKFTALLLAMTMVMSLAACGSKSNTSDNTSASASTSQDSSEAVTTTADPITLNVAYMPNYASLWAVMTGIEKGYFAEEGITINLVEFADGPSEIAAMEGGSIDLAYIGKGAHKLCILGRAVIFAPSSVHTSDTIVVSGTSGIETLEDLKGKVVAFNSGSSSESTLDSALSLAGLTREDIKANDMDVSYMVSAMMSGSIDAAVAWNPYTSEMVKNVEGAKEIEFSNGSINLSSWICLPEYAENNHDILVRYSRALYKAMDYASDSAHWEEVAQWCANQSKTSLESNLAQTGDATWFDSATLSADLQDGTLVGYYEHLQQDFLNGETITASDAKDVNEFVLFNVMQESLGTEG
jgi:NitT/TauT family transport system substrate-binding protein